MLVTGRRDETVMTMTPSDSEQGTGEQVALLETGEAVADMLTEAGLDVLIPGPEDSVVLKITNVPRVLCDLTIASNGSVTCDYRTFDGGQADAAQLAAIALSLLSSALDESAALRLSTSNVPLKEAVGRALAARGMRVTLDPEGTDERFRDAGADAEIVVTNPAEPERGTIGVDDDGALWWACRAYVPAQRLSGLGLDEVAATVARALAWKQPPLAA